MLMILKSIIADFEAPALNSTLRMLDILAPYGPNAAWDAHIGGDAFEDSGGTTCQSLLV